MERLLVNEVNKGLMAVGRKCTICHHPEVGQIDKLIRDGVSFRGIAGRVENTTQASLHRHANEHLGFELKAVITEQRMERAVNVHAEFDALLQDAVRLKTAAMEYLSDPFDPLKTLITPHADEIEVVYLDWSDMTEGENPKPKRKRAPLSELLRAIKTESEYEPDKVTIKHVDLRKFALDCLARAESLGDKFAQLAGLYKEPQKNDERTRLLDAIQRVQRTEGIEFADAWAYIARKQQETGTVLFSPAVMNEVAKQNSVHVPQELGGVQ